MVSAKGLSCAAASRVAGQGTGSPGFLSAKLHSLHGPAGLCILSRPLFAFSSRQTTWASHIAVSWTEKKPQIWLHLDTAGLVPIYTFGSVISCGQLEDAQAKGLLYSEPADRTRKQQDLGLHSTTLPGVHLVFLVLPLTFHHHPRSLYLIRCTRIIKKALGEL